MMEIGEAVSFRCLTALISMSAISENFNFNMELIKETETGFSLWYRLKQLSMAPSVVD